MKVTNEAAIEKKLTIGTPQAGPVYSGQGRNDKDPKADPNAIKRFAQLEMYTTPPMTAQLSGLTVEYAIALLYSSEAGKREITVAFDVGQGTQDLGFRGEVPVLFDIKPAIPVKLKVLDFDGKPTVGRFARCACRSATARGPLRCRPRTQFVGGAADVPANAHEPRVRENRRQTDSRLEGEREVVLGYDRSIVESANERPQARRTRRRGKGFRQSPRDLPSNRRRIRLRRSICRTADRREQVVELAVEHRAEVEEHAAVLDAADDGGGRCA